MRGVKWEDGTGYSWRERGEKEPTVWRAVGAPNRITVHRYIGIDGAWFLSCHDGIPPISMQELKSKNVEDAKQEALEIVYQKMRKLFARWKQFFDANQE